MVVLAIESTCDETGASVVRGDENGVEILSNVVASSVDLVKKYGGVVPEVAAREQVASILPVIQEAIENVSIFNPKFSIMDISAVGVTKGPGLMGSLLVGIETAKVLAHTWNKPLIGVNHMMGHVAANWIIPTASQSGGQAWNTPRLPAVAFIVSGGHTDLYYIESLKSWGWIGGTRDDAVGEAFDKAAMIMGLPYPGGPSVQREVDKFSNSNFQFSNEWKLPRPMIHEDNLEMSFSGLKTALARMIYDLRFKINEEDRYISVMAYEFNCAVVDILTRKLAMAVDKYQPKSVLIGGGVSANKMLRERLNLQFSSTSFQDTELYVPDFKYCTDNAAMVGAVAILRPDFVDVKDLKAEPGLEL